MIDQVREYAMKKVICLLLAVILMISLASCGKRSTPDMPDEDSFGATVLKLNDIDSFQAADYPMPRIMEE